MTSHSLVPKAANAAGIDYQELCWRVLETSLAREPVTVRTSSTGSRNSNGGAQ
jgi:D-alanine-D-alanine ligase